MDINGIYDECKEAISGWKTFMISSLKVAYKYNVLQHSNARARNNKFPEIYVLKRWNYI